MFMVTMMNHRSIRRELPSKTRSSVTANDVLLSVAASIANVPVHCHVKPTTCTCSGATVSTCFPRPCETLSEQKMQETVRESCIESAGPARLRIPGRGGPDVPMPR